MKPEPGGIREGFVLAGGGSARMGRDKSMLIYRGQTLLERAVTLLETVGLEVGVIVESQSQAASDTARRIPDLSPGLGPLGGIYTALKQANSQAFFILACDLPLVPVGLVRVLLDAKGQSDLVIPCDSVGRVHPLCGIYAASCLRPLQKNLRRGRLSVQALLEVDGLNVRLVDVSRHGFADRVLFNVNNPEDYSALLREDADPQP